MSKFIVVSRRQHAALRWQRYTHYRFAAQDAVMSIVAREMPRAALSLPIAFVKSGEAFVPVVVQGFEPGQNLLVGADGRWQGAYTPAAYRGYPFQLARGEDGQNVLCLDEESGLITAGPEGERFFAEDGTPAPAVKEVFDFLATVQSNREVTTQVCAALQAHGLIKPWPLTIEVPDGRRKVDGLYMIDEAALQALPAEALVALRNLGALPMIYCQLLSMQNLEKLGELARGRLPQASVPAPAPEVSLDFFNKGGTIDFGKIF